MRAMLAETIRRLQPLRGLPAPAQYAAATLIVLAVFALRHLLVELNIGGGELPFFLLFVPAVVLSALLFDKGAGYFAVAVGFALALYLHFYPDNPFAPNRQRNVEWMVLFVLVGLFCAAVVQSLRRSVDRLQAERDRLAGAHPAMTQEIERLSLADAQKELLLGDIHHRIKNHLQMVSGYLLLGQRDAADDKSAELLGSAANRLKVLARVYDRLQLRRDASTVSARGFIEELVNDLQPTIIGLRPIVLQAEAEDAELSSGRAVTMGLIVNELVTNAVRFAFDEEEPGCVYVYFRRCAEGFCLEVVDDGKGFRSEERSSSLGQRVLQALVQQLGGTVEWSGPPGTRVSITFPAEHAAEERGNG